MHGRVHWTIDAVTFDRKAVKAIFRRIDGRANASLMSNNAGGVDLGQNPLPDLALPVDRALYLVGGRKAIGRFLSKHDAMGVVEAVTGTRQRRGTATGPCLGLFCLTDFRSRTVAKTVGVSLFHVANAVLYDKESYLADVIKAAATTSEKRAVLVVFNTYAPNVPDAAYKTHSKRLTCQELAAAFSNHIGLENFDQKRKPEMLKPSWEQGTSEGGGAIFFGADD